MEIKTLKGFYDNMEETGRSMKTDGFSQGERKSGREKEWES